jgi:hypothetical protein
MPHSIRCSKRQVALMVKVANLRASDEQKRGLEWLGALEYFRLEKDGDYFIWNTQ